jgi:hypothetical protein
MRNCLLRTLKENTKANSNPIVRFSYFALTIALLVGLSGIAAVGQVSNTRVTGTVTDPKGAAISGATVTLTDKATNSAKTVATGEDGQFAFNDVREGDYSVSVEAGGFKKTNVVDVTINIGQTTPLNIAMEIGDIGETVNVTSSDAQQLVHSDNAELKTTVLGRQIQDLPLNGRNPLTLAGLQAGVNTSGGNRTASVNGLRGSFTNLTWDGININDNFVRTDSFFGVAAPSVVSVSEFTLVSQNSGPGDGLGVAQIKLVTPRGSNEYHGSFFNFLRNDALDANTFFNNANGTPREKLIRNQFGFNIGGPWALPRFGEGGPSTIGKDKLFFYFYYEGTLERTQTTVNRTVLDADSRTGVFQYRRADNNALQSVNLLALAGARGVLDPVMVQRLNQTPVPNNFDIGDSRNTGGFRFNTPSGSDGHLYGFRLDYDANSKHRFEAIYSKFKFDFPNDTFNNIGEVFPGLPGAGQGGPRPRGSFAWHWAPTGHITNELRGGFNYYNADFINQEDFAEGFQLAFPLQVGSTTVPLTTNPVQNFLPQGRNVKVHEFMDNASWVKGNHFAQFGGSLRLVQVLPFNDVGVIPSYTLGFGANNVNPLAAGQFPGGVSTNDFTSATRLLSVLIGSVTSGTQTFNVRDTTSGFVAGAGEDRDLRNYNLSFYGNDTWRVRPNLTFSLGLRWEFQSVPTEKNGLALLPRGGTAALFDPNAILDFAGGDTGRPFFNNDLNNFAPSVSFAWDPWESGKTSIRGGYSISYVIDNNITTVRNAFRGNAGLVSTRTITGISGTVSSGGIVPIPAPVFAVPRTQAQNIALDPAAAIFAIDENLRTPYVQQWNVGIEREFARDTVFEVRYVGNHGVKLSRGLDFNQMRIFDNGFLADFRRAQFNQLNCAGNPNPTAAQCPGRQALTILNRLGNAGAGVGHLNDASVRNIITQGQVGELASFYALNRSFFLSGAGGGDPTLTPSFFLPANANAFAADLITNGSWSNYHGLQAEVRRRLSAGLYFQANYTFSKAFTDFEGSQTSFLPYLDNALGGVIEKQRSSNDITHVFKTNAVYELPFGPGKRFLNWSGAAGKLFGGWSLNGISRWQSGEPISIVSARGTLNRTARSASNTVNTNLTISQLQDMTGVFYDPVTTRPRLFDPALTAQLFNPTAGTVGTLQLTPVSGPSVFFLDMSVIKRTSITENVNIEFRAEAFNVLNHTAFNVGQVQNINAASFGQITTTFDPRILQFALKLNF